MDDNTERPRGILAPVDREYLLGDKTYDSRQSEYKRKCEIRERVKHGIIDFTLLFDHLEFEELQEIIGGRPSPGMEFLDPELEAGFRDALAFTIECTGAAMIFGLGAPSKVKTKELLEAALERMAWKYGHDLKSMELEIEADRLPEREWMSRLEEGQELPPEGIAYFLDREDVDNQEIQEAVRSMVLDEDTGE